MSTATDPTEAARRARLQEIESDPRRTLLETHGPVWDTDELQEDFTVLGFLAPFVVVRRKSDGARGSLEFLSNPRFYFHWQAD